MAIVDAFLTWSETGQPDLLLSAFSIDLQSNEGISVDLSRQRLLNRVQAIEPRLALVQISGAYSYIDIIIDGVNYRLQNQNTFTIRLAKQKRFLLRGRIIGNSPANVFLFFYNDDSFAPLNAADIYAKSGTSGEPSVITYSVAIAVAGPNLWTWDLSSDPPFNVAQDIRIPITIRPENSARYDQFALATANGRVTHTLRGRYNGALNSVLDMYGYFGFGQANIPCQQNANLFNPNYYLADAGARPFRRLSTVRYAPLAESPYIAGGKLGCGALMFKATPQPGLTSGTSGAPVAGTIQFQIY